MTIRSDTDLNPSEFYDVPLDDTDTPIRLQEILESQKILERTKLDTHIQLGDATFQTISDSIQVRIDTHITQTRYLKV